MISGELVSKKPSEPVDGAPFVAGIVTLLKQFHSENTDQFLALLGQYVRSLIDGATRWVLRNSCLGVIYWCLHALVRQTEYAILKSLTYLNLY